MILKDLRRDLEDRWIILDSFLGITLVSMTVMTHALP